MYNNDNFNNFIYPPQKKAKKIKFRHSMAAVIAVVALCGSIGYGGGYLAAINNPSPLESEVIQLPTTPSAPEESLSLPAEKLTPQKNATYTPEQLYVEVKDTVVGIKLYQFNPYDRTEDGNVVGSGVIFTTDGYLLTNYHVVTDNSKIGVIVNDYNDESKITEYPATVIGLDEPTDLAILKIERKEPFKAAAIGNSDTLKIGQTVCPIGNPLGLSKSMSMGIVSGLNREGEGGYELNSIQIDAAVNMGNSGGPLFDMYGNVVGIVNKKLVYDNLVENIGFAITINEAKPVINDLMAHGEVVSRPVLGITTMPFDKYFAVYYGFSGIDSGLLITGVQEGSSAEKNGITKGDVLVKVNDKTITSVEDVQSELRKFKAGDTVTTTVVRFDSNGRSKEYNIKVKLMGSNS